MVKLVYFISNITLLELRDKDENVAVIGAATASVWKEVCETFCPVSRIRPVTTPEW